MYMYIYIYIYIYIYVSYIFSIYLILFLYFPRYCPGGRGLYRMHLSAEKTALAKSSF